MSGVYEFDSVYTVGLESSQLVGYSLVPKSSNRPGVQFCGTVVCFNLRSAGIRDNVLPAADRKLRPVIVSAVLQ